MKDLSKYNLNCTKCTHYEHKRFSRGAVSFNVFQCDIDEESLNDKPPAEHYCNKFEQKVD